MEAGVAVALITSISGIIIALVTGWFMLKTNQKIDDLEDKIDKLEQENCKQKKVLRNLRGYVHACLLGIEKLIAQIASLGHNPVWRPENPPAEAGEDYE